MPVSVGEALASGVELEAVGVEPACVAVAWATPWLFELVLDAVDGEPPPWDAPRT